MHSHHICRSISALDHTSTVGFDTTPLVLVLSPPHWVTAPIPPVTSQRHSVFQWYRLSICYPEWLPLRILLVPLPLWVEVEIELVHK